MIRPPRPIQAMVSIPLSVKKGAKIGGTVSPGASLSFKPALGLRAGLLGEGFGGKAGVLLSRNFAGSFAPPEHFATLDVGIFRCNGIELDKETYRAWEAAFRERPLKPGLSVQSIQERIVAVETILELYASYYQGLNVPFTRREEFHRLIVKDLFRYPSVFSGNSTQDLLKTYEQRISFIESGIRSYAGHKIDQFRHLMPGGYASTSSFYKKLYLSFLLPTVQGEDDALKSVAQSLSRRFLYFLSTLPDPETRLRLIKLLEEKDTSVDHFEIALREAARELDLPDPPPFRLKTHVASDVEASDGILVDIPHFDDLQLFYVQAAAQLQYRGRSFVVNPEAGIASHSGFLVHPPGKSIQSPSLQLTPEELRELLQQVCEQLRVLHDHDFQCNALWDIFVVKTERGVEAHLVLAMNPETEKNPRPWRGSPDQVNFLTSLSPWFESRGLSPNEIFFYRTETLFQGSHLSHEVIQAHLRELSELAPGHFRKAFKLLELSYRVRPSQHDDRAPERILKDFIQGLKSLPEESRGLVLEKLSQHQNRIDSSAYPVFFTLGRHFEGAELTRVLDQVVFTPGPDPQTNIDVAALWILGKWLRRDDANFQANVARCLALRHLPRFDKLLVAIASGDSSGTDDRRLGATLDFFEQLPAASQTPGNFAQLFHWLPVDFTIAYRTEAWSAMEDTVWQSVAFYVADELKKQIPELKEWMSRTGGREGVFVLEAFLENLRHFSNSREAVAGHLQGSAFVFGAGSKDARIYFAMLEAAKAGLLPWDFQSSGSGAKRFTAGIRKAFSTVGVALQPLLGKLFLDRLSEFSGDLDVALGHLEAMTRVLVQLQRLAGDRVADIFAKALPYKEFKPAELERRLGNFLEKFGKIPEGNRAALLETLLKKSEPMSEEMESALFAFARHASVTGFPQILVRVRMTQENQRVKNLGKFLANEGANFQESLGKLVALSEKTNDFPYEVFNALPELFDNGESREINSLRLSKVVDFFEALPPSLRSENDFKFLFRFLPMDYPLPAPSSLWQIFLELKDGREASWLSYIMAHLSVPIPELNNWARLVFKVDKDKKNFDWSELVYKDDDKKVLSAFLSQLHHLAPNPAKLAGHLRFATQLFEQYPQNAADLYSTFVEAAKNGLLPRGFEEDDELVQQFIRELNAFLSMRKQKVRSEALKIFCELLPRFQDAGEMLEHLRFMTRAFYEFSTQALPMYQEMSRAVREGFSPARRESSEKAFLPANFERAGQGLWNFLQTSKSFLPGLYATYLASEDPERWLQELEELQDQVNDDALSPEDLQKIIDDPARGEDYALAVIHNAIPANAEHFLGDYENQKKLLRERCQAGDLRGHIPEAFRRPIPISVSQGDHVLRQINGKTKKLDATTWEILKNGLQPVDQEQVDGYRGELIEGIVHYQKSVGQPDQKAAAWSMVERLLRYAQATGGIRAEAFLDLVTQGRHYSALNLLSEWFKDEDFLPKLVRGLTESEDFLQTQLGVEDQGKKILNPKVTVTQVLAQSGNPEALQKILGKFKASEIEDKILRHPSIQNRASLVDAIQEILRNRKPDPDLIAATVLAPMKEWIAQEVDKFGPGESQGKTALEMLFVKGVAHALFGRSAGTCTADKALMWANPDFLLIALRDPTTKKILGYVQAVQFTSKDGKRKYLSLPGINPAMHLLEDIDAKSLFGAMMEALTQSARAAGYSGLYIPVEENIRSNRPPINAEITTFFERRAAARKKVLRKLSRAIHWDPYADHENPRYGTHPMRKFLVVFEDEVPDPPVSIYRNWRPRPDSSHFR